MKNMKRNEWIAVAVGLGFITYAFAGGFIMNLFNMNDNTSAQATQSGVQILDESVGQGDVAGAGDTVTVHYVGALTNGKVFDSSLDRNQPIVFVLGSGQVIKGWDQGLLGMKVGGKRKLIIGPDFGYGSQDYGPIPGNSTLIFEVELVGVKKATK